MFRIDARENPEQALRLFYRAAMYKLVMAVLAFLVIGKTMPERVMPVLIGFGAATLSYWFALLSKR